MEKVNLEWFSPADDTWSCYAQKGLLRSALDPRDQLGNKNLYIDRIHKLAVESAISTDDNLTVLDFGCGSGRLVDFFSRNQKNVYGADITFEMLQSAKAYFPSLKQRFIQIDGINLPFAKSSFDVVISIYVLQYIVKKPEIYAEIIKELSRIIKPGGQLILIEQFSFRETKSGSVKESIAKEDYITRTEPFFRLAGDFPVRLGQGEPQWLRELLNRPELEKGEIHQAAERIFKQNKGLEADELSQYPYVDYLFNFKNDLT